MRKGIDKGNFICYNICVNARTERRRIMFDRNSLLYILKKNDKTISDLALKIGRNEATVYRKLRADGDFTRNEIILIAELIGWKEVNEIFFAAKLA